MRRRGEPRLRPDLAGIPVYRPGRAGGPAGPPVVKLSSNENPYPPLPQVRAVIAEAAGAANRYPDMFATDLVAAIAEHHRVPVGHVVTGTGSVGVAQQLLQATTGPGDEVVYAWRSFEAYPILVQISGAGPVAVPLTAETRHDLPAMADAVTERTRCVIVCTPNNPTGPAVGAAELDAFLDRVPDDVLVVLDEAYREFVREPAVADGVEVYRTRANVAVLRTFSKAYGLAGLRVGYVIAHDALADAARACAVPFGVSGIAQAAALASLGAQAQLAERVEAIVAERARLVDGLRERGWPCPATEANFVWLPVGERTEAFAAACEAAGVAVRPFPGEGVRVTVGAAAANDVVLDVAADVLGRRSR